MGCLVVGRVFVLGAAHAGEETQEFTKACLNDEAKFARGKEI